MFALGHVKHYHRIRQRLPHSRRNVYPRFTFPFRGSSRTLMLRGRERLETRQGNLCELGDGQGLSFVNLRRRCTRRHRPRYPAKGEWARRRSGRPSRKLMRRRIAAGKSPSAGKAKYTTVREVVRKLAFWRHWHQSHTKRLRHEVAGCWLFGWLAVGCWLVGWWLFAVGCWRWLLAWWLGGWWLVAGGWWESYRLTKPPNANAKRQTPIANRQSPNTKSPKLSAATFNRRAVISISLGIRTI